MSVGFKGKMCQSMYNRRGEKWKNNGDGGEERKKQKKNNRKVETDLSMRSCCPAGLISKLQNSKIKYNINELKMAYKT